MGIAWAWYSTQWNLFLGINSSDSFIFGSLRHFITKSSRYFIKHDSYFITKCGKSLSQNTSGFLFKKWDTFTTCGSYCKMQQFNYKKQSLLKNALEKEVSRQIILSHLAPASCKMFSSPSVAIMTLCNWCISEKSVEIELSVECKWMNSFVSCCEKIYTASLSRPNNVNDGNNYEMCTRDVNS